MILFFKKLKNFKLDRGMTYVELIVVLGIFALLSAVAIFNYGTFQAKIDIKNLASDIALKFVEAQKSAMSGNLPADHTIDPTWKPAYGLYFSTVANSNADDKKFIYFADLDNNNEYSDLSCTPSNKDGECLDAITITRGDSIASLDVFYQDGTSAKIDDMTVIFKRPNSGATIVSSSAFVASVFYVQVSITSPNETTSVIKIYSSGRIQIN